MHLKFDSQRRVKISGHFDPLNSPCTHFDPRVILTDQQRRMIEQARLCVKFPAYDPEVLELIEAMNQDAFKEMDDLDFLPYDPTPDQTMQDSVIPDNYVEVIADALADTLQTADTVSSESSHSKNSKCLQFADTADDTLRTADHTEINAAVFNDFIRTVELFQKRYFELAHTDCKEIRSMRAAAEVCRKVLNSDVLE